MTLKNLKFIIPLVTVSVLFFVMDKLFFQYYLPNIESRFEHSIENVFGFFLFCSILIILILIKIKQKNINNVGQSFLLITSIKMVLSLILAKPILDSVSEISKIEKYNFLIIFGFFLILECYFTIRMLNNEDK